MDSLHRIARDCRLLLFSIQLTLMGALVFRGESVWPAIGLLFGVVAFLVTVVVGIRMLPSGAADVDDDPSTE